MGNKVIYSLILLFCLQVNDACAQLSLTYSFGSIVSPSSNLSSFSGPVIVNGYASCLQVANGVITLSADRNDRSAFKDDCGLNPSPEQNRLTVYPNPVLTEAHIFLKGGIPANTLFSVQVFDANGIELTRFSLTADQLRNGYILPFKEYAAGFYVVMIIGPGTGQSFKLMKMHY